ncbi:MAG: hypothetical protein OXC98_09140 [bacterium]|nr:hypothetical protein [Acidimicrobiia bacterium]MCY4650513.1 hypothetical protein [bacterium]
MPDKKPLPLRLVTVLSEGIRAFLNSPAALMARSLYVLAVPAVVLAIWQAGESTREGNPIFFWVYLFIWCGSFFVTGYVGWPLARTALAAASPDLSSDRDDDWWVRDGFVRATAAFSFTVAVGMVFLVIPGLMVLMIYTFYPFLIIEKKTKGFMSLAMSAELTSGNRIRLLIVALVMAVLFIPAAFWFYRSGPGLVGILGFWLLAAPALSVAAVTMAAAYRILTDN